MERLVCELTPSLIPTDLQITRNVLLYSKYHGTQSTQSCLTDRMPLAEVWYLEGGEGEE